MDNVIFTAAAPYHTRKYGEFRILATDPALTGGEHIILVKSDVAKVEGVLCRIASKCITSAALDASECDCAGQNYSALAKIKETGRGLLIYLDQEGRSHGLATKIRAMNGKQEGLDTYAAVEQMGLEADIRDFTVAVPIIAALDVASIVLLTNNPLKGDALRTAGVRVTRVIPCHADNVSPGAIRHLKAKQARGHSM